MGRVTGVMTLKRVEKGQGTARIWTGFLLFTRQASYGTSYRKKKKINNGYLTQLNEHYKHKNEEKNQVRETL